MIIKSIPILWLVEHVAREMEVACAVKSISKSLFDIDITIRHIYHHAHRVLRDFEPQVIVLPFLYRGSGMAIKEYTEMWPNASYLNLAWEEIFYKAQNKIKAPADSFAREKVIHHAWGDFYRQFLIDHSVEPKNIFVNGHPAYQLYKLPYRLYFKSRELLAKENGLDPQARWVFVPENYRWAFVSDTKLSTFVKQGGDLNELLRMKKFCKQSLEALLTWCSTATKNPRLEIIFRPRPSTSEVQMRTFFMNVVRDPSDRLHFIKTDSVRDWILASDVVISSYSTSLIEAAIAGRPVYMSEPIPIPPSLYCSWYSYVPRLHNEADFQCACNCEDASKESELAAWASRAMLSRGDPIKGLAVFLQSLLTRNRSKPIGRFWQIKATCRSAQKRSKWRAIHLKKILRGFMPSFSFLSEKSDLSDSRSSNARCTEASVAPLANRDKKRRSLQAFFKNKTYSDLTAHEGDQFTELDVRKWVESWDNTFAFRHRMHGVERQPFSTSSMKRDEW